MLKKYFFKKGAIELANIVSLTMGRAGKFIAYDNGVETITTKDGFSVSRFFKSKNKYKMAGAKLIRQAAARTVSEVGDGTTGTLVLAREFLKQNISLKDIRSLDKEVLNLVDNIKGHNIGCKDELRSIAYISSNFDREIANIVSEAVFDNGVDGSYIIEEQYESGLNSSQVVGYSFKSGYLHNAFVNTSNGSCVYDNPYILIKENYCLSDIIDVVNTVIRDKNPLVIIGEPDEQVLQSFVKNHLEGVGSFCLISPTGFGKSRDNFLNDLKAVIGGDFGKCEKIVVKKHSTIIQHNTDLKDYITALSNTDTLSKAEQDDNKKRIAALKGKVCVFKIGADSVAELRERKDRLEDSILSSISALKKGYVTGGGKHLYDLSFTVDNKKLKKVLQAPYKQIIKNAKSKGIKDKEENYKLIDSALVISTSLKNAWSVAKEILQTDYVIVEDVENAKR